MGPVSAGQARVVVVAVVVTVAALALALVLAVVAWSDGPADEDAAPQVRQAAVVDDLCAVVEPLVPAELDLRGGQSTTSSVDGAGVERAACTVGSAGDTLLEVRVTTYDVPEGDPHGSLDQLVATACGAVAPRATVDFVEDERGCSGQDAESVTEPVLVTATRVGRIETRNAVVSVALTDRRLPAQVAAYAASITYGVVASDLEAGDS